MDESYTGNNNSTRKSKCLNEQVENLPNNKTTCSVEISSLDDFNSNSDVKSSLPTRKQRLKEYLTTTHDSEIDITSANEVFEFPVDPIVHPIIHLIDIAPKLLDNKKPVKVKSRWTRSSQMELAQENSIPLQTKNTLTVNNLAQSSEIINEIAVTPVNGINKQDFKKSIEVKNLNMNIKNCHVALQPTKSCTSSVQVKRKRGRPKKTVIMDNKDVSPVVSDIDNQNSVELDSFNHLKPKDSDSPKIVKRGRGRPKKNGITPDIVETPQLVSKIVMPKKRGRKKLISTVVENHTNSIDNDSSNNISNSEDSAMIKYPNQYQSEFKLKLTSNSSESGKPMTSEEYSKAIKEGNFAVYDSTGTIVSSENYSQVAADLNPLYRIDEFIPPFTPVRLGHFDDNTSVQTTKPCNNIVLNNHQDMLLELNNVNWNPIHKKTRSKSVSEFTKVKQRRNSLSDNFIFQSYDDTKIQIESNKLKKSWKSLSYIQGGPNIQIERYQRNELDKKFRSELKRSRSFPNCMLLDTVIWRFLVYEQTNDCDENYIVLSDSDITLINELSVNEYNRQYRSKSVPLERNEFETIKNSYLHKSLDNLNILSCTYDLPTYQVPSDICDMKNDESDLEENEGKIRRSKRLNTKVKDSDMLEEEYLLESEDSKINYLLKADEIRQENEKQLSEAQKNDPDLENKLRKLGFKLITNNLFKPSRKEMSEYTPSEAQELRRLKPRRIINTDTYKCHCKYSKTDLKERRPGCGSECLNRLLNIECGTGCSLKSHCTNKQFQNKQFKRTQIVKTPDKGYGVFALEDIPSGTFVDEYMGEVIDQHEMIKRMKKKLYRNNNYMVQLKHDEIIDATRKGNITRFINHSCEPNCVAEKWNVLGESRMGFFSKISIAKGEEITFDYSFEIFGDAAQQKCYCGTPKCRGYISKKSRTGDPSSSEESDDNEDIVATKPDEPIKKKKLSIKKITNKDKKRLRELDQQLTDISKLKNKNRSDLESSTLNLNKLMVHITDSMSRSHILKFIRENDLNCKRLFMNFNGLSIIHSWMISNDDESLKLEIIQTLSELPISNRNTITKSKVIDIVAKWANIPENIKEMIENLEYPVSQTEDHEKEVDKLLPDINDISCLANAARVLWKKWIILKMVFKIPKLDRQKEVNISDVSKPSRVLSQSMPKPDQYNLIKSTAFSQHAKINYEKPKTKMNHVKYLNSQSTPEYTKINSIDNFSKMINHQNQMSNHDKNKAVIEWNKKWEYSSVKQNKVNPTFVKDSNHLISNVKHGSVSAFNSECMAQEIPTIESSASNNKIKWNTIIELTPTIYEVPTDYDIPVSTNNIFETELNEYYPIEEIITSNRWLPPKIDELHDMSTLECILKMAPPCTPDYDLSSLNTSWCTMKPENVFYDAGHPSIEEQNAFIPVEVPVKNTTQIKLSKTDSDSDVNIEFVNESSTQKMLFRKCEENLKNLFDKGLLNRLKSSKMNYIDQSPMKISESFFKKNLSKSNIQPTNKLVSSNLFKCLKISSNFYQKQPSNIIKVTNFQSKSNTMKSKNNAFRIKEKKSVKSDLSSIALKLCNKQLTTTPQNVNLSKLLKKHSIKLKTENKLACKLFDGLLKRCHKISTNFTLKLPLDTENYIIDPFKEFELHQKLIPTVKNTLCAKLIREENNGTLNVFKQKLIMKYDESKSVINMGLILKQNQILSKTAEKNNDFSKKLKRKLIWSSQTDIKKQKLNVSSTKSICDSRNQININNQMDDNIIFKKPMIPVLNKKNYVNINTTHPSQVQRISKLSISKPKTNEIEKRQKAGPSNQLIQCALQSKYDVDKIRHEASTSNQSTSSVTLSKINTNEIRQKPLMKCSPFNKVDNISAIDLEQNVKNLATSLCMDSSIDISLSSETSSEQIESIVENFKTTISLKKATGRANLVDDPIVRDYIQRTQLKSLELKRKYKLPESMLSLPVEVLNLVPDNQKEIKYVVDFYHAMATVIVKVLDVYVKKSCKQGRIKNDEDFKYLAKRLNSNILFKELQVKKVEDLKISDSVKLKVEQYIKKYMLKYGKVYRRKSFDP